MEKTRVIVLNADYQPVNVTSFKQGCKLVYKGKAEIISTDFEKSVAVNPLKFSKPQVIRLLRYIYLPHRKISLNKQNLFKRDKYKCGYCESKEDLTIDHIVPRSRGGKNTWENLVTCCSSCNRKKDNRTPDEAKMKLKTIPYAPSFKNLLSYLDLKILEKAFVA